MLYLLFSFALAQADFNVIPNKNELSGWNLSEKDGLTTATHKEFGFKKVFSKKDSFVVFQYAHSATAKNWDYLEGTADGKQVVSNTHCYPPAPGEQGSKPNCKTVTSAYCASLNQLTDSKVGRSDISTLNECHKILEKVDFDVENLAAKHKTGMQRIYTHLGASPENFTHSAGKAASLFDVVNDYFQCKSYEGRWATVGKKAEATGAPATPEKTL